MYKQLLALFVLAGLLAGSIASAAPRTFTNPVITGMNPDPSICRAGDDYYLVTSTFEYFPGLPVYHSKDLLHWRMIGHALDRESQNRLHQERASGGQYAPTIRYHDGTFYIIGTNYADRGVFYVTAKNPAGPWSEPHWLNIKFVDPSFLFADGKVYYVSPDENGDFQLGVLDLETDTFEEPRRVIARGRGGSSPEGPHLYKINGYYYLMSAEGGTGYEHREVIQRSRSPWGPYEPSPINPVASHMNDVANPFHAIGHADLVQLPDESWWLVCLGIRPRNGRYHILGRETFLAPVTWTEDGWPKVGTDGIVRPSYTAPALPEHIWETSPIRDDFDNAKLGLAWNFVRNPYTADWSLTEKPGVLRLHGSKISAREQDSPAYICRRQTAFDFVASAKIAFTPTAANEEAGLLVRADDANHYDFVLTTRGGKRVALLRQFLQNKESGLNCAEIGEGDATLRISGTDREYTFWVQEEGKPAVRVGTAATKNISTEMITGFTGVFIGMYASGNGQANTHPADFDWFDFEEHPKTPFAWSTGAPPARNGMTTPAFTSLISPAHDVVTLTWTKVATATGYKLERHGTDAYETIANVAAGTTRFTDSGLSGSTLYEYRVTALNTAGASLPSITASVLTPPKPGPFFGAPSHIPGRIEAENFDHGKRGATYDDSDKINSAEKYRTDGADIEFCWDAGGGYNLCQIVDGEWVLFTVDVEKPVVDVELRVVSPVDARIRLELDGKIIAEQDIASTGGWQPWTTIVIPGARMEPGKGKQLKVSFPKGGFNLNWLNFR
ncbi:MAG TPA: family 43 glycosylhydrolase [Opitutaceae bacterium]|nr:family 43 glycosylhydrolase [Opitutaceae bacterium]